MKNKKNNYIKFRYLLILTSILFAGYFTHQYLKSKPISPFKTYANLIPGTYRIGFTNLDHEIELQDLKVEGEVPKWLSGTLYRNGPAKFTSDNSWISNWFDGLAMIHAFEFSDGKVSYRNKFLRTDDYEAVQKTGKMAYAGFMEASNKNIVSKLFSAFFSKAEKASKKLHNANVNIDVLTDNFIALTEIPLPVKFDPNNLNTLGALNYDDNLPKDDIHDTAHLHYDFQRKEHIGYFTTFGRKSYHNLFTIKDGSTTRNLIASYEIKEPSYMHSFAITKNFAVLTLLPLVVNPLDLFLSTKGFIQNFKFKPELGTKFLVIDRINNKIVNIFKTKPFFAFHTVNAYEEDDNIICDIVIYRDARGLEVATFDKILAPHNNQPDKAMVEKDAQNSETGKLTRFIINLKNRTISSKTITDELIELPRINYKKFNTKDYNFVYAYASTKDNLDPYVADVLVKINVKNGFILRWQEEKCYPGEPVFVEAPNTKAEDSKTEDNGVVLSLVLNAKTEKSFLLILDAKNFKELARINLPHHVPFGIHGLFV